MLYKATVSFCGVESMTKDEVRELTDPVIVNDLLNAGHIIEYEEEKLVRYKDPATKKATRKK